MKNDTYEIDVISVLALCLVQWRRILAGGVLCALLSTLWALVTFKPPAADSLENHQIDAVIYSRSVKEEQLLSAEESFRENQYYTMEPDKLLTKRLSIAVELLDQSQITDQIDPTDLILYAYHNMARTDLQGQALVPELLSRLQLEQLFSCGYDTNQNILTVSITADDEALMDAVLAAAAQWYLDHEEAAAGQTQPHKLSLMPVSVKTYDRESAEEMVSTLAAEAHMREIEASIFDNNTTLDEKFHKPQGWASTLSVEELTGLFQEKIEKEQRFHPLKPLVLGGFLGGVAAVLWICTAMLIQGRLPADRDIVSLTGWRYIGRLSEPPKPKDLIAGWGLNLLHGKQGLTAERLEYEVRELTHLLLKDHGVPDGGSVALVGHLSEEAFAKVTAGLSTLPMHFESAGLLTDRIAANALLRRADAVIFLASASHARRSEVKALDEILKPLGKEPVGYILV